MFFLKKSLLNSLRKQVVNNSCSWPTFFYHGACKFSALKMVWKLTFELRAGEPAVGRVSGWVKRADRADRASGSSSKWDQSRERLGETFYLSPEAMSIARESKTEKLSQFKPS